MKVLVERMRSGEESVGHEEGAAGDGVKFRTSQGDRYTANTERSHLAASLDSMSAVVNPSRVPTRYEIRKTRLRTQ